MYLPVESVTAPEKKLARVGTRQAEEEATLSGVVSGSNYRDGVDLYGGGGGVWRGKRRSSTAGVAALRRKRASRVGEADTG